MDVLRSFLVVYRLGSFSRAAESLNLTQPAVSKQMALLEGQLGKPLFTRLARGILPTPAAHELARKVGTHLDALEATLLSTRLGGSELAGTVYLGGPAEFLSARVLPLLGDLSTEGLQVRVRLGQADSLLEELAAGGLDLVVATVRARAGLAYQPLFKERFILVASPERASRLPRLALLEDGAAVLSQEPLLAYAEDLPILRRYWKEVFGVRLEGAATLVVEDLRGLLEAARASVGITALPDYLVASALREGSLVALLEPTQPPSNLLYLASRRDGRIHPRVAFLQQRLLQAMVAYAGPLRED